VKNAPKDMQRDCMLWLHETQLTHYRGHIFLKVVQEQLWFNQKQ